jgi:hypothetical protein
MKKIKIEKFISSDREVSQRQLSIFISKNKQIELSFIYTKKEWSWFEFLISWTRRKDNAGLDIYLEILMCAFRIAVTDKRFWDYENDCWEKFQEISESKSFKYF